MKKIFISYHHKREQCEKNQLSRLIEYNNYYLEDMSVDSGDIDQNLPADEVYRIIRENYLRDTDVTIVILGLHTKCRKHIDREIGSSLRSYGWNNTKNGLVILLTDDFVQRNVNSALQYYQLSKEFISKENSGQRIFDNVINNYVVIGKFNQAVNNIVYLKDLVDRAYQNSKTMNPNNSATFRTKNTEDCPKKQNIIYKW